MSDATELIRAVLAETCPDDTAARVVIETALGREVDPLLYCAVSLGLGEALVMERAARWAGLAYFDYVPVHLTRTISPTRLDGLADVRTVTLWVIDRQVAFAAPDFLAILRLRERFRTRPALRFRLCLVPATALRDYLASAASEALTVSARQGLSRHWPFATAQLELTKAARHSFILAILLLVVLVTLAPFLSQAWLLPIAAYLLLGPAIIRLLALLTPVARTPAPLRPDDPELPVYSILIPLRDETQMVPQLFAAMRDLDYPAERLDIKFVVETRSPDTVTAVEQRLGDPRFSIVRVADALPRTKPKALDYALPLCRGDFVVVFDAEDIPDPDQLWKAALRFRDEPDLACLQARLVIANCHRNWLASLFGGEYAGLFAVLLPSLARWRLPMPLGGTSNHFPVAMLRQLGGWDAFNVTEDADLGARLARRRLRVETLDSATFEAAPIQLGPWLGQRTRWMKGWMQTFIVHNRNPGQLLAEMGPWAALSFETLTLGMIVAPLLHVSHLAIILVSVLFGLPMGPGAGWPSVYVGFLCAGYGTAIGVNALGLWRLGRLDLLASQLLLPIYWLLVSVAMARALIELASQPFYWFKSPHLPTEVIDPVGESRDATVRMPQSVPSE